jgi:hypothetical protein
MTLQHAQLSGPRGKQRHKLLEQLSIEVGWPFAVQKRRAVMTRGACLKGLWIFSLVIVTTGWWAALAWAAISLARYAIS